MGFNGGSHMSALSECVPFSCSVQFFHHLSSVVRKKRCVGFILNTPTDYFDRRWPAPVLLKQTEDGPLTVWNPKVH